MKETGILMTKENILATIEGRKTMTRRVIKVQPNYCIEAVNPEWAGSYPQSIGESFVNDRGYWKGDHLLNTFVKCPYGQVGDFLYLKEAHYRFGYWVAMDEFTKTGLWKMCFVSELDDKTFRYIDDPPDDIMPHRYGGIGWYKRSPLFMPKQYARYWNEITGVMAERLQDISSSDIQKEGIPASDYERTLCSRLRWLSVIPKFIDLWDSINAKRGHPWANNEWVWPISYKLLEVKR